jgi:hypothetical protein
LQQGLPDFFASFFVQEHLEGFGDVSDFRRLLLQTIMELSASAGRAAIHKHLTDGNLVEPRPNPIHVSQQRPLTDDGEGDVLHHIFDGVCFLQTAAHDSPEPAFVLEE